MPKLDFVCQVSNRELNPPTIPQRSRLYSLEPIGLGTSLVESATSYLTRLSVAHSVSVGILFYREVAPLIYRGGMSEKDFLIRPGRILGGKFIKLARSINGTEKTAKKWAQALESLTLRNDLNYLTM